MADNIPFGGGGSSIPLLAPDLTYPSDKAADSVTYKSISGIDGTSGLATALSLSGSFKINYLEFNSMTSEQVTIKMTIDGDIIFNDTFNMSSTSLLLFGGGMGTLEAEQQEVFKCNSSLLLEIQTTTDNSVGLSYLARPIK